MEDAKRLKKQLTAMLKKFHEICVEQNLRYYVIGGTALGAARHKGFIPWDDDIDVGMPREDYERLKTISCNKKFGNYVFEYPSEAKDFVYPFGKMYDTTTTLIENTRYKTKRGIYIDIFPLDGACDSFEEGKKHFKKIDKKNNLLSTKVCAWRKGRKLYKNLAMLVMRHMPGASAKKLMSDIGNLSKVYKFDECIFVANYVGNWHEKEISKREWFGTPTEYDFEDIKVYGPEKIDEYLTGVYGDWRTPPPVEKQVTHHDYIECDLDKSYLGQKSYR